MYKRSLIFLLFLLPSASLVLAAQSSDDEAARLLKTFLDKNRHWIAPEPQNLYYQMHTNKNDTDDVIHRVWIGAGERARWEESHWQKNCRPDESTKPHGHLAILFPGREFYKFIDGKEDPFRTIPGGKIRYFTKGITFETGLQALAMDPEACVIRLKEREQTETGAVVVLEADLDTRLLCPPLDIFNRSLAAGHISNPLIHRIRLGIKLPEYLPVFEEGFYPLKQYWYYRVEYGPEFLSLPEGPAPARLLMLSQDPMRDKKGPVELHFQDAEGTWLFKEGFRKKDGEVVSQAYLDEYSRDPVAEGRFDLDRVLPEGYSPHGRLIDLAPGDKVQIRDETFGCFLEHDRKEYEIRGGDPVTVDVFGYADGERIVYGTLNLNREEITELDRYLDFRRNPSPFSSFTNSSTLIVDWFKAGDWHTTEETRDNTGLMRNEAFPEFILDDLYARASLPVEEANHFFGGTVTNDLGQPVANVRVEIDQSTRGHSRKRTVFTDAQGGFYVEGLIDRKTKLKLFNLDPEIGYLKWPEESQNIGLDRYDLNIRVDRPACISGWVEDSQGNPLQEFHVKNHRIRSWQGLRFATSARSGQLFFNSSFKVLSRPGSLLLEIWKEGYAPVCKEFFHLPPGVRSDAGSIVLQRTGTISGTVHSPDPGLPLADAMVYVVRGDGPLPESHDQCTLTGADGSFNLQGVWPGDLRLMALHPKYCPSEPVALFLAEDQVLDGAQLKLTRGGCITGRVQHLPATVQAHHLGMLGSPEEPGFHSLQTKTLNTRVKEKQVNLYQSIHRTDSDAEGFFSFENLPPGLYELRVSLPDFPVMTKRVAIQRDQSVRCDFVCDEPGEIEGTVSLDGAPLSKGIMVYLRQQAGTEKAASVLATTTPDAYGRYRLSNIKPGLYSVTVTYRKMGAVLDTQEKQVRVENQSLVVDFTLQNKADLDRPCGRLTGRVLENGRPAEGARVRLESMGSYKKTVFADSKGFFQFQAIPEGDYHLYAIHRYQPRYEFEFVTRTIKIKVHIDSEEPVVQDLVYTTGSGSIHGKVFNGHQPADRASIEIFGYPIDGSDGLSARAEVRAGNYTVENLPPGRYEVTLSDHWQTQFVQLKDGQAVQLDFNYE